MTNPVMTVFATLVNNLHATLRDSINWYSIQYWNQQPPMLRISHACVRSALIHQSLSQCVSNSITLKFLLYVLYVGPVQQYIAMYCRTGIRTGTYNRNFRVLGDRFCAFKLMICPKRASSDQIFAKHTFVQCCRLLSTACYCSYALPGGSNDRREKKNLFRFSPFMLQWIPRIALTPQQIPFKTF